MAKKKYGGFFGGGFYSEKVVSDMGNDSKGESKPDGERYRRYDVLVSIPFGNSFSSSDLEFGDLEDLSLRGRAIVVDG